MLKKFIKLSVFKFLIIMANLYHLLIHSSLSLEQAWNELEEAGIEILYGSEENGQAELYVSLTSPTSLVAFDWVEICEPYTLPAIDWEAQWAAHGLNFHDGFVHLDFTAYGRHAPCLKLKPGSGFGDLSHPTTRLVLRLLARHLRQHTVIDIGCGSGVLTLAAIAMGAPLGFGIDIDYNALEHSRENARLNQLDPSCIFCYPDQFIWNLRPEPVLILMNMIQSEQKVAWSSLPQLHPQPALCLTSGIRQEERESYLAQAAQWGWSLQGEEEEMGWLGFIFQNI